MIILLIAMMNFQINEWNNYLTGYSRTGQIPESSKELDVGWETSIATLTRTRLEVLMDRFSV